MGLSRSGDVGFVQPLVLVAYSDIRLNGQRQDPSRRIEPPSRRRVPSLSHGSDYAPGNIHSNDPVNERIACMFVVRHWPIYPLVTLLLIIVAATLFPADGAAGDGGLVWIDNYDKALAETRATGKPMLLAFRCVP